MESCALRTALSSAVEPSLSRTFGSAPAPSSASATSRWPCIAASISAVRPSKLELSGGCPSCCSICTHAWHIVLASTFSALWWLLLLLQHLHACMAQPESSAVYRPPLYCSICMACVAQCLSQSLLVPHCSLLIAADVPLSLYSCPLHSRRHCRAHLPAYLKRYFNAIQR